MFLIVMEAWLFGFFGGNLTPFWIACFFVFVAEMGDKTQLMTLSFSTRYKARTVLAAVFVATLLIHLVSVTIGDLLGVALPVFWINFVAGLVFIGFGLWSLRKESSDEKASVRWSGLGPLITVGTAFFLAEFGDRTMLATIMIASRERSFFGVWMGSTVGMVMANALAIIIGKSLGKRIPERVLKYAMVMIFIASGLLAIYEAFCHR